MTLTKTIKNAARAVKSVTKKVAKKVDKAVVDPVVHLVHSDGKGRKKSSRSKTAQAKKTRK